MGLQKDINSLKEENLDYMEEEIKETLFSDLQALAATGIAEAAPHKGQVLPDFSLPNAAGKLVTLSELRAQGPVVITFYRGGWCPYCNLELRAYQKVLPQLTELGATLVAITPELPDESLNTTEKNELQFQVLTDQNSEYAQKIQIAFVVNETIRPIYESFGIDLEKHNGQGQYLVPLAATYVVDQDGVIVFDFVNADYTLRAEPADVIECLKLL